MLTLTGINVCTYMGTVISQQFDRSFKHYTQTNSFGFVLFLLSFSGKSGSTQSDTMWCRPAESQRSLQEKVSLCNKNIYIIFSTL